MHRRTAGIAAVSLIIGLSLILPLLIAACGGETGEEGLLKRELPENATPEKIMLEALNATDEAKSLAYIFDYAIIIPPTGEQAYTTELRFEGNGESDAETGNTQAHLSWPAFEREFDYKIYDDKQYFQMEEGGTWYELPQNYAVNVPSVSEITRNTSDYMDNFQKISRLEDEMVDERDCYHIAMVPNFDAIMENEDFLDLLKGEEEQLDEETMAQIEELKEMLKDASVNYEYWVDKEYLVLRRTLYNIEMVEPGDEETSPYTVKVMMEVDFPIYNLEVVVTQPEATEMYQETSS